MARIVTATRTKSGSSLDPLIEKLTSFSADNYWDLGKFLVDKIIPTALKEGIFAEQIMKRMSDIPGFKFPFQMLRQCQMFYTYYPDVRKRQLPEAFYFELATRVDESKRRDSFEKQAIKNRWTISDLQKAVREDEQSRRMDVRTRFGFELKERNIWTVDVPDPRFGKAGYKGRLSGQVVANALFYFTKPGSKVVDPMAGSGTTGDIIENVAYFQDREVKMYDLEPSDERIARANILQTGIPEESGSTDYVFLDPPGELYTCEDDGPSTAAATRAESMMKLKTILRESARILRSGGRVSIVCEPAVGSFGIIDFPFEITLVMKDLGFVHINKVYLPRHSAGKPHIHHQDGLKPMRSDCREMLTFEKVPILK